MTLEDLENLKKLGIPVSQADMQEAELRAAGWKPIASHPRSFVWRSPDGVLMPGPTYSWNVMKGLVKV